MGKLSIVLATAAGVLVGCEQQDPLTALEPTTPARTGPGPWQEVETSPQIALPPADDDPQLARAIDRARSTAQDARRRWTAETADRRRQWAVKWAAPTQTGGVEHVWVVPTTWTRDRIEGWLSNPPQRPLECGRTAGELVSFTPDQLSDWMRLEPLGGKREGGFTVKLLEERYGRPQPSGGPG